MSELKIDKRRKYASDIEAIAARKAYMRNYMKSYSQDRTKYSARTNRLKRIHTIARKDSSELLDAIKIIIKNNPDFKIQLAALC